MIQIAKAVKTRGNWHHRHQQHLVEQMGEAIGEKLPVPDYYGANVPPVSGYWRYTIDKTSWDKELEEGSTSSQSWPNPEVNLEELPPESDVFGARVQPLPGIGPEAVRRLWNLAHGMQAGDHIIAHQGSQIMALGIVDGDYEYHPEESTRMHRRSVQWEQPDAILSHFPASPAATKAKSGWGIVPLTEQDYNVLTGSETNVPGTELNLDVPRTIQQTFQHNGLTYTPAQIATFYTALQTKGFVVLSGISGTGKSKIAQHFVDMLPSSMTDSAPVAPDTRLLSFRISPVENWAAIPASQSERFPPIPMDVKQNLKFEFEGVEYQGSAILKVLAKGKPTLYFAMGDKLATVLRESDDQQTIFAVTGVASDGEHLTHVRLATNPRDLIDDLNPVLPQSKVQNNLFLAVRPDWRDSTSLLGYYNPLTETYEWTAFLRFLLRAKESFEQKDGLAWFVILDEMNLAHVEYYFADLLSIIESGRDSDGFSREAIHLTYPDTVTNTAPPHEIKLPPNLYIIGTVNMDETTHAFSPKVLDRAFTIELTDVDFSDYPPVSSDDGRVLSDSDRQALLTAFTRNATFAQIDKVEIASAVEEHPEIRDWLQRLNTGLQQDRFHFGYRVFDEISQFVFNADNNGMFGSWEEAFDHAVFMKVLPKFNGSHARLSGPLRTLLAWAINPVTPDVHWVTAEFDSLTSAGSKTDTILTEVRFERVGERALRMMTTLEADGFVSFG